MGAIESISFFQSQATNVSTSFGARVPADRHPCAMDSVGQRILYVRQALGRSQEAFAKPLGVSRGAVGNWERDQGIKTENLSAIARTYSVPLDWLANAIGEPPTLDRDDQMVRMPVTQPDAISRPGDAPPTLGIATGATGIPPGAIAEVNVRGGLGDGTLAIVHEEAHTSGMAYSAEEVRDWWRLPDWLVRSAMNASPAQLACFPVEGDSMEPSVRAGDVVFINLAHRKPSPDGIYAIADSFGGVQVKRIEVASAVNDDRVRVRIISDNPRHSAYERPIDDVHIIGRVIGIFSRK